MLLDLTPDFASQLLNTSVQGAHMYRTLKNSSVLFIFINGRAYSTGGAGDTRWVDTRTVQVTLDERAIENANADLSQAVFHESVHAIQADLGLFSQWSEVDPRAHSLIERPAYQAQEREYFSGISQCHK